ncbi:hypothetical protein Nmel_009277, partial [Mimus melanotis]
AIAIGSSLTSQRSYWLKPRRSPRLLVKTTINQGFAFPPPCPPPASTPKDIASTATESRERARGGGPGPRGPGRCGGAGVEGPAGTEGPGPAGSALSPRWSLRPARCPQTLPRGAELLPGGQ